MDYRVIIWQVKLRDYTEFTKEHCAKNEPAEPTNLVTFTEEILNEKLHFLFVYVTDTCATTIEAHGNVLIRVTKTQDL